MNLFPIPLGTSASILSEATMERLGWVLVHSLWQFLLIAILALAVLRFMKRSSASLRYAVLVLTMAVCVVLPVATWFSQSTDLAPVVIEVRAEALNHGRCRRRLARVTKLPLSGTNMGELRNRLQTVTSNPSKARSRLPNQAIGGCTPETVCVLGWCR